MEIGHKIKVIREVRRMTQRELAKQTGMQNTYLSLIENGYAEPNEKQLTAIKNVLCWTAETERLVEELVTA